MPKQSRLVYSTEAGRICPECEQAEQDCSCKAGAPPAADQVLVVLDTKHRKGKGVTVLSGLGLEAAELGLLAKALKQRCGVGGSVKDWTIEIQGDQREKVRDTLTEKGFKVRTR